MPTIQILTRNNQKTIKACLESLLPLESDIVVGDLGSTDDTIAICDGMGAITHHMGGMRRDDARNRLAQNGLNIAVEPWEVLAKGNIKDVATCAYASVMDHRMITKEIRLWRKPLEHVNPTFETIATETKIHSNQPMNCSA